MVEGFGTLIPDVAIVLEKYVPAAAGLGGGSADAAAMLRALCRLSGLNPLSSEVHKIALSIGADVPACLQSRACRMRGIGEKIEILSDFPSLHVVLANARVPVSTADVFQALKLKPGEAGYPPIVLPFELTTSRNDLTPAATGLAPIVNDVLEALRAAPDVRFVRMSGSGGTCFAVFDSHTAAGKAAGELASLHPDWWIRPAVLQ
jgi:4-diphosphocytidyl-2-C-methyl-D-erythritol kinase